MEIHDEEQYRERGFGGFVEYLQSKPWGISERHAFRQIAAAQVAQLTDPSVNLEQASALAPLLKKCAPEVVCQVFAEVLGGADVKKAQSIRRLSIK